MWPPPRRSFVGDQKPKPPALPADNHAGRLRRIAPCGARAESRWLAAREDQAALIEIPEQPDRAGPSGCEAAHCCDARLQGIRNAAITIAGIELLHRIRKGQFRLGRLGLQGQAAPEVWNAVLGA